MAATQQEYTLRLPDGRGTIPISFLDASSIAIVASLLERSATVEVHLTPADEADTAGHAMTPDSALVAVTFGDDVEGHTLSLRFPNPAAAFDFQKRLMATGVVVATLAVGAVGIGIAAQSAQDAAPQPGPAIVQPHTPAGPPTRDAHPGIDAPAPSVYYSASSAQSGVHGPETAPAPSIYYSASSAQSGVHGPAGAAVDDTSDVGLGTGAGTVTDGQLPDQTNPRGPDKELRGV
jgi:hypothetical protein